MFSKILKPVSLRNISVCVRKKSVWSSGKIISSPYKDIEIPDLTVDQYTFRNLDKWATKTAVVCGVTNKSYTYEQVYKKSRTLAANLRKKFQIQDGDVISVMLPNVPEYAIVTFGILAAGGVATTLNPVYTAYEVQRQIATSNAKIIITNKENTPIVKEAIKLSKKAIPIITMNNTGLENTASLEELTDSDNLVDLSVLKEVRRKPDDVAFLPYSSGTTGLPKGVELTNKNIVGNCQQQNTELRQFRDTTGTHQDSVLLVLPVFHFYGLGICMLHKMSVGLKLVMLPKFQPDSLLDALLKYRLNLLYLAPPMVLFLGSYPQVTAKHLEAVTNVTSGAAPLPDADIHRLFEKAQRDIVFTQGYGMTEAAPLVTLTPAGQKTYTEVGYALPSIQLRVVDDEMKNLAPGEIGELLVKGPNVMKGYLNNPEANKDVFLDDKWLRSGDLVKVSEDGLLTIAGRLKELIKVKGYQVPPAELENVLKEHPAILDVAVIGIPDGATGEKPKAFVVLKNGASATEQNIKDFVKERVAPYKRIEYVAFLDSIPKNPSGKILRRTLQEEY